MDDPIDCLIIGGGPAGSTAAIYLARYHLSVLVIDDGHSRAAKIPLTRNHAGFPNGISGPDLLALMREQASRYGACYRGGTVETLETRSGLFVARAADIRVRSRTVLLALGVSNRRPTMPDRLHDEALARGLLRYCPVCDGYEVTDRPVAVIGTGAHGVNEAEFLRSYTADVTLVAPDGTHTLAAADETRLRAAGIKKVSDRYSGFELADDQINIVFERGQKAGFSAVYPALGSDVRSKIAADAGAKIAESGCIVVDDHQRTGVAGLYAAGDVVVGLDQISYAMGQGGVAATAIRNELNQRRPLRR